MKEKANYPKKKKKKKKKKIELFLAFRRKAKSNGLNMREEADEESKVERPKGPTIHSPLQCAHISDCHSFIYDDDGNICHHAMSKRRLQKGAGFDLHER